MGKGRERTEVLMHGIRVLSPGDEVFLVGSEFLGEGLNVCWVFVEEDLAVVS
jgi:hypothetical protein